MLTLMATAKHRHHTATTHSISLCTDHMNLKVKTHLPEIIVVVEGRQIKEKLSVRVRHRSTNTGTETEAYRQNTHSSRLG